MKKIMFMLLIAMMLLGLLYAPAMAEELAGDALPGEFFTWDMLGSYGGAILCVALVTQLTKELPYIKQIPTQLWSYILAVLILLCSQLFTGKFTTSSAVLCLFNGVTISLAANGGYTLITRVAKAKDESEKRGNEEGV